MPLTPPPLYWHPPLVTTSLFSISWACLFFVIFTSLLHFLDSTYKWYDTIFVFVWLVSLSIIPSKSIHVAANDKILFFFYGWVVFHCVCVCVCVCVCKREREREMISVMLSIFPYWFWSDILTNINSVSLILFLDSLCYSIGLFDYFLTNITLFKLLKISNLNLTIISVMRVRRTSSASLYYFKKCSWLCFTFSFLENF